METKERTLKEIHNLVISHLNKNVKEKDIKVLDLGCDNGFFGERIKEKFGWETYFTDSIKQNINNFVCSDFNKKINFKSNFFNIVFSFDVFEHLENPYNATREVNRILKKRGYFYLKIPYAFNIWERLYFLSFTNSPRWRRVNDTHITFYTRNTLFKMLESNGFTLKDTIYNKGILPYLHIKLSSHPLFAGGCCYIWKKEETN